MADLIYVALVVAFFVVAAGLLRACEFIIGPDDPSVPAEGDRDHEPVAQ